MKLDLYRKPSTDQATLGELHVDDTFECVTLEDPVRDLGPDGKGKVYGKTAIPAGTYKVVIAPSPSHQNRPYMRLLDVPFFQGILIHSGNTPIDTLGCVLVGQVVDGPDRIHGGSLALPKLFGKVRAAIDRGEDVRITIHNRIEVG